MLLLFLLGVQDVGQLDWGQYHPVLAVVDIISFQTERAGLTFENVTGGIGVELPDAVDHIDPHPDGTTIDAAYQGITPPGLLLVLTLPVSLLSIRWFAQISPCNYPNDHNDLERTTTAAGWTPG